LITLGLQSIVFICQLRVAIFTTYRSTEITIEGLDKLQQSQMWRCVEQEVIHPWYYVQIGRWGRRSASSSMMMIHHAHELRELVDRQSNLSWLEQVHFVCPPHMNGTSSWTMEPLIKISVLTFPNSEDYDLQINVAEGHSYFLNGIGNATACTVAHILYDATRDISPK